MKKHIVITSVLLVLGIALCVVGAVICGLNDDFASISNVAYTEHTFETESNINSIDFELKGNYNFIIQSGERCSLRYSESELSTITVQESSGTLKVVEKTRWTSWIQEWFAKRQKTDLVLTVTEGTVLTINCEFDGEVAAMLPAWEYGDIDLEVNGSAIISTDGNIVAKDVELDISGSGQISLSGEFNNVEVETSGGSIIDLTGRAQSLTLSASGSSKLKSYDLKCDSLSIKASGSVDVDIQGEAKSLVARASGACRIYAGEFALSTAEIYASGSTTAKINVSEKLTVRASGSAKIDYYGDPEIDKDVSGIAQINKVG